MSDPANRSFGVEQLVSAGLYDPERPGAADRLAALRLLIDHGATTEDLVAAVGDYGILAARLALLPPGRRLSRTELAAKAGVQTELVERLWRAAGFPDPGPEEPMAADEHVALLQTFAAAAAIFGEEPVFRLVRVVGAAMARVADAIVSSFNVNVAPGAGADPSGLAIVRANLDSLAFLPMLNSAMDQLLRLHLVAAARPGSPSLQAGYEAQQLTIGFADLVASTVLAAELSGRELGEAFGQFEDQTSDLILKHKGRVVKLIGDEIMFATSHPNDAYVIALDVIDAFTDHPLLPAVRVGLASGEVLTAEGDCFGPVVNLAARAVREAQAGEAIVAAPKRLVESGSRLTVTSQRQLKGFAAPVVLARLNRT